ncbi:MAG TPA: hypothetical protein VGC07_10005 [Granulicella sp.]
MFKKIVVLAVLAVVGLAPHAVKAQEAAAGAKRAPSKTKTLTNAEFDALLAHPEKVLILDVRRPDEVSGIGGFPVYLSIQIADLKNHLSEIPKDRGIITVSNHAARAGVAGDLLSDGGFHVLGAIGADTYQKDGGKLAIKIPVPPPASAGGNAHAK